MNNLKVMSDVQTMSSREIAELTGKRHGHVLGDIRRILNEVGITLTQFEGVYKDQQLIERPCFNLPYRETNLIIAGYSAKHRLAIIDRWQELENAQPKTPQTFAQALRLAADIQEKLEESNLQLELKTQQLDESKEWLSIKRVAKQCGRDWQDYSWIDLKRTSIVMGKPPKKIFDANYGEVNTYHITAWVECYPEDMAWFETLI